MKISEAISQLDELHPNQYSTTEKIKWLSRVDAMVHRMVIETHKRAEETPFEPYPPNVDQEQELLMPSPWDDGYISYMEAMIGRYTGEIDTYNMGIENFEAQYNEYAKWYHRNHPQIQVTNTYY